jgi:xanthosine utilization system XapX-like protein
METADPILRGLATWAMGPIVGKAMYPRLKKLIHDQGQLTVYCDGQIVPHTVGQLAQAALDYAEQRQLKSRYNIPIDGNQS